MMKKLIPVLVAVVILISGCGRKDAPDPSFYGPYEVVRVVDGDTVVLNIEGKNEKVRLIGIDAPESVHPDSRKNTEEGRKASEYLAGLLDGESVYMTLDAEETDSYGRILAYLWDGDGNMINLKIVGDGYAQVYTVSPNVTYSKDFVKAEEKAVRNRKGLWA